MTHDEKIQYLKIALGIAGLGVDHKHLNLMISIYELVLEKKGETTLDDVIKVEYKTKENENVCI